MTPAELAYGAKRARARLTPMSQADDLIDYAAHAANDRAVLVAYLDHITAAVEALPPAGSQGESVDMAAVLAILRGEQ